MSKKELKNKGFTLVELLAVFVLLGIVMILVFPSLKNLLSGNNEKQYQTYEDLMVEYTKLIPNYQNRSKICLKDLDMKELNQFVCTGYVSISDNNITPYLSCTDKNGNNPYKTTGYNDSLGSGC